MQKGKLEEGEHRGGVISLTAIEPYKAHKFSWASFKLNNFLNFCPFATFDSSKCS